MVIIVRRTNTVGGEKQRFRIEDPAEMARVLAEIQSLPEIDWQAFTVEADNEAYLNASAPLNALSELLPTLLAVIILVSGIILTLILTLWSKSRLHETGVLLSLGFSKAAIIGQYLLEVCCLPFWPLAFPISAAARWRSKLATNCWPKACRRKTRPQRQPLWNLALREARP